MKRGHVFLIGAGLGAISFIIAKAQIPSDVADPSQHDLALAHRIGFVFPAMTGLCVGWIQQSLSRMMLGICVGSVMGFSYALLCGDKFGFLGILLGYPMFCGGFFAMILGKDRDTWVDDLLPRLLKGLLAGLVCGIVYTVSLNIFFSFSYSPDLLQNMDTFSSRMWKAGPFALAAGGGVFLMLFCWAIGIRHEGNNGGGTGTQKGL